MSRFSTRAAATVAVLSAVVVGGCSSGSHSPIPPPDTTTTAATSTIVSSATTAAAPPTSSGPTLPAVATTPVNAPPGALPLNLVGRLVTVEGQSGVLAISTGVKVQNALLVEAAHATVTGLTTALNQLRPGMYLSIAAYSTKSGTHRVFTAVTIIVQPVPKA